jgi:hypothetical protein
VFDQRLSNTGGAGATNFAPDPAGRPAGTNHRPEQEQLMSDRRLHRERETVSDKKPASTPDYFGYWLMAGLIVLTVLMALLAPAGPALEYDPAPLIF